MIKGHNFIGFDIRASGEKKLQAFSTVLQAHLPGEFIVATDEEINTAVSKATVAFEVYRNTTFEERAIFLESVAGEMGQLEAEIVERCHLETGLPKARITGELGRTVGQLKLFA